MRMYDIIKKKRDGGKLTEQEIRFFIEGYVNGQIPDYQVSALLMAIFFSEMDEKETTILTEVMAVSGEQTDLSEISGIKVDKHSTGGVGDKTSLVIVPLAAAAGIPVAKMSGRGLGHTGGTIDKLESIPGFKTEMEIGRFFDSVRRIGVAITGQTGNLAPADKKLYALRDVTATVDNISLIASSIMSKKIASGADCILLDVKVGSGAFMKDFEQARKLAELMVNIGNSVGRRTVAVISNMDQPLGYAVGNALEVKEAIDTIKGEGPEDFNELCRELGAIMLVLGQKTEDVKQGREMVDQLIASGRVVEKFKEFVENQGGDSRVVEDPGHILPKACNSIKITASSTGCIERILAEEVGRSAMLLGAGRAKKGDQIDLAAGIVLHKKVGDPVEKGEALATFYFNSKNNLENAVQLFENAVFISNNHVEKLKIIKDYVNRP